ncbi:MAG: DUF1993 domain-containing protein [Pseudomonadales bacterium]|nr:DUF1993 domain-containing protein [Pseudomonadales bacterium]
MALSLYDVTIPAYLQILGSVGRLVGKAEAYCTEQKWAPPDIIGAKLADDMLPYGYQIKAVVSHSVGAIDGVRKGVFSPDRSPWPETFAGLKKLTTDAIAALDGINAAEVESFVGRDMRFEMGEMRLDFTAENFLLSFSQPNFYFHAATAYDILRWKGMPIGKRDFTGRVRVKS